MPGNKRTILLHEDKSKEYVAPKSTRIKRHLSRTFSVDDSKFEYKPTQVDSFKTGLLKSKEKRHGRHDRRTQYFGMSYERKF